MRVRVWYWRSQRGVGSGLEKGNDKGNMVVVLIVQMVSLSKEVERKI
jgi:hypothetical protein